MKIIITEQEKLRIIDLHNSKQSKNKKVVNEQFDNTTGVYKSKFGQLLMGIQTQNQSKKITIPSGTTFWHDWNKNEDNKVYFRANNNLLYFYDCAFTGAENVFQDKSTLASWENDPLSKVIRSYFCSGKRIKTWDEIKNKDVADSTIVCKEANGLYNTGQSTWDYAKVGDCYYTKKSTDTKWVNLQLPKNVNSLNAVKKLTFPETTWCGTGEKAPMDINPNLCDILDSEIKPPEERLTA